VCQLPIGQLSHMADVPSMTSYTILFTCMNAGSKRISFITEGLLWKITVNNWSIYRKKTTGTTFPVYKKERKRRSRAFPSDSNPAYMATRRRLRSYASHRLYRPFDFTVGKRAFPVAGANMWNDLPFTSHHISTVTRGI